MFKKSRIPLELCVGVIFTIGQYGVLSHLGAPDWLTMFVIPTLLGWYSDRITAFLVD